MHRNDKSYFLYWPSSGFLFRHVTSLAHDVKKKIAFALAIRITVLYGVLGTDISILCLTE